MTTTTATTTNLRTLTARFPGSCKRCGARISVGDVILYGGKGLTYCVGSCSQQPVAVAAPVAQPAPAAAPVAVAAPLPAGRTMSDSDLAALHMTIRLIMGDLMAQPVRLGEPTPVGDRAKAETAEAERLQQLEAAERAAAVAAPVAPVVPVPVPVAAVQPVAPKGGRARQAAPRAAIRPVAVSQVVSADDLF